MILVHEESPPRTEGDNFNLEIEQTWIEKGSVWQRLWEIIALISNDDAITPHVVGENKMRVRICLLSESSRYQEITIPDFLSRYEYYGPLKLR